MLSDQQVLQLINRITGDDFCAELDILACHPGMLTERETAAWEKLAAIYKLAHAFITSNLCYSMHDDWRADAQQAYAELTAEGEFEAAPSGRVENGVLDKKE